MNDPIADWEFVVWHTGDEWAAFGKTSKDATETQLGTTPITALMAAEAAARKQVRDGK
jgi:hypothetical protein